MAQVRPTAAELIEAVREFIAGPVSAALSDQAAFHARIATNVLAMVERELQEFTVAARLAPQPPPPTGCNPTQGEIEVCESQGGTFNYETCGCDDNQPRRRACATGNVPTDDQIRQCEREGGTVNWNTCIGSERLRRR